LHNADGRNKSNNNNGNTMKVNCFVLGYQLLSLLLLSVSSFFAHGQIIISEIVHWPLTGTS
jgi:hypothetical protein